MIAVIALADSSPSYVVIVFRSKSASSFSFWFFCSFYNIFTTNKNRRKQLNPVLSHSLFQICVLHSVNHCPIAAQYTVTGTTYAPEGFIFDSTATQVNVTICNTAVLFQNSHFKGHIIVSAFRILYLLDVVQQAR